MHPLDDAIAAHLEQALTYKSFGDILYAIHGTVNLPSRRLNELQSRLDTLEDLGFIFRRYLMWCIVGGPIVKGDTPVRTHNVDAAILIELHHGATTSTALADKLPDYHWNVVSNRLHWLKKIGVVRQPNAILWAVTRRPL